ncbi:hypothetical protein [Intestinicryptomonas porci]|uniref:Uncharacterized protein n=1 Tax=Intestinicryptomonas porci TaxID=2926320 RepID=A0ABU4WFR1_9BACT|nr:hypothetical protein [Opitutales bacterium CLA-KB-P66]
MKKYISVLAMVFASLAFVGCATTSQETCPAQSKKCFSKLDKKMFYKDGKFNQEAAKQAYFDMMEKMGYTISENMRKNMWATDFGLGDFPAVGMGGIFWVQENKKNGLFGHEILLLPNQMLVEHYHVPADGLPAKWECWQARAGTSYCFGEVGEEMSKYDVKVPESQKKYFTQNKVIKISAEKGNIAQLNRQEARHSQIAGPEGAIVTEYGVFHGDNAQRFTNPGVKF